MKPALRSSVLAAAVLALLAMRVPGAPVPAALAVAAAAAAAIAGAGLPWMRRAAWAAGPAVVALAAVPASRHAPLGGLPWHVGAALAALALLSTLPKADAPPALAGARARAGRRPLAWSLAVALMAAPLAGAALLVAFLPDPLARALEMRSGGAAMVAAAAVLAGCLAFWLGSSALARPTAEGEADGAGVPPEAVQ